MSIDDVRAAMASWCLPAAQAAQLRALLDDHARLAACDEGEHHEIVRLRAEVDRLTIERDAALANTHTMVAALDDLAAERDRWLQCNRERQHEFNARAAAEAEVDRLTRERDEAESALGAAHETLAGAHRLREDRDRLAAALAEVREAVEEIASHGEREPGPTRGMGHDLRAVLVATPADLAAAHDARVRAEALREAADEMENRARTAEGAALQFRDGEFPSDEADARFWRNIGRHRRREAAWLRAEAERIGGGR